MMDWRVLGGLGLLLAASTVPVWAAPAAAPVLPTMEQVCGAPGPDQLTLPAGANRTVAISRGHLNRLVTPFPTVRVKTTDESASVEVQGRVVYFATHGDVPVTVYLTPEESEDVALSLTLVPCGMAPRELQLTLAGGYVPPATPAVGGTGQPYVDRLTEAFRELALQRVPAGYTLRAAGRGDALECALAGLQVTPVQVLEGTDLTIIVARVEAVTTAEIDETGCAGDGVAAVAAWPNVRLAPGDVTELYVARRQAPAGAGTPRPSLLR